eukprot:360028-Chlamydomonas_euryale.AAC.2
MIHGPLVPATGAYSIASSRSRCVAVAPTLFCECAAALMSASADQIPASELCLQELSLEPSTSGPAELNDDATLTWRRFWVVLLQCELRHKCALTDCEKPLASLATSVLSAMLLASEEANFALKPWCTARPAWWRLCTCATPCCWQPRADKIRNSWCGAWMHYTCKNDIEKGVP